MTRAIQWVLAAVLTSGLSAAMVSCSSKSDNSVGF